MLLSKPNSNLSCVTTTCVVERTNTTFRVRLLGNRKSFGVTQKNNPKGNQRLNENRKQVDSHQQELRYGGQSLHFCPCVPPYAQPQRRIQPSHTRLETAEESHHRPICAAQCRAEPEGNAGRGGTQRVSTV